MPTETVPAVFAEIVMHDRPERPRRDPMADRLTRSALLRRYGWTEADADRASGYGLPAARGRLVTRAGLGESYYSDVEVRAWAANVVALAAQLAPTGTAARLLRRATAAVGLRPRG